MSAAKATKMWYVFDQFDCFTGGISNPFEAAIEADNLVKSGMTGVHMAYMTTEEFNAYCKDGKFPFAK